MRSNARKPAVALALIALAIPAAAEATARGVNGRIAFDNDTVWTMNLDGSSNTNVGEAIGGLAQSDPACSPTGRYIALIDIVGVSNGAVVVADSNGENARFVSTNQHAASGPAWSPDESRIAWAQYNGVFREIAVADADTVNESTTLTGAWDPNTGQYADRNNIQPDWSPDGTKIAFASDRDGDYDIYTITLATGVIKQITNNPGPDVEPSWAPGGGRIAFTQFRSGNTDVWVMRSDGSAQVNVTGSSAGIEREPSWSPDGRKIAFTNGGYNNARVFKMNPDGTGAKLLADPGQSPSWCGSS